MCRIKMGKQIEDPHDVQNLVTALILRSRQPYSIPALSLEIKRSCAGSELTISDTQIAELVRDTTTALLRAKYLSVSDGLYYAKPVSIKD